MRLYGLLAAGLLLLFLGGLGVWWGMDRRLDTGRAATVVSPNSAATDKGVRLEEVKGRPAEQNAGIWVVWYGDDAAVYRLRVNAAAYGDLYAILRKSLAQDQMRLESIAGGHLYAELAPVFAELSPRLGPFLDDLFDVSSSASLLGRALDIAIETVRAANPTLPAGQAADQAREQTRARLADEVVGRFRNAVLLPGFTLRALRGASGRAFVMLRQDLLEDCDRYDRAFRGFVLTTPGTVETREGDIGWRPDPSWQQGNATFLSLCQDLRRTDAGQLSDAPVIEAFAAAEEVVQAQALELVRPMADAAVEVALSTQGIADTLGLSSAWTRPLATGMGYISSAWTLVRRIFDQLGGAQGRERFMVGLQATLDGLQTDGLQRLHTVYRGFIAAEMERIGLNLAARSEGVWSHP